ncbi:unnamed protein product [Didymodactylos carnosus]|uniref:Uncharacterized protein n=2 Tax=Didymodactylos carnosus TaxID=1234261 RepID=A0A813XJP0_9BILA|nr:unnamed protein product [Didymodactylos carnosus]CAF3658881.1 unnamed protein product [Didymodactylos carnosus]
MKMGAVERITQHLPQIMEKQFRQLTKQVKKEMEQAKQKNEHRQLTVDDHSSQSDEYELDESSKTQLQVNDITLGAADTQASRQSNSTSNAPTHSEDVFTNMQTVLAQKTAIIKTIKRNQTGQ